MKIKIWIEVINLDTQIQIWANLDSDYIQKFRHLIQILNSKVKQILKNLTHFKIH